MKNLNSKSIVLIILIILLIIFMLSISLVNMLKNNEKNNNKTTTITTTTTTKKNSIELKEENYGVVLNYEDKNNNDLKLDVTEVKEKINIDNILVVYDINLKDSNDNIIKVNDTEIAIKIPYENKLNYTKFKVLYLNEDNEILETIPAEYFNGSVTFKVNHLSRYAILGEKEETSTTTTTTKKTTTKKVENIDNKTTTTTSTTTKKTTVAPTPTKKTTTTTKKTTTTTTTKKTTQKVKTYTYQWGSEKDSVGQQYLYIIDESGKKVSGTVLVSYVGSDYSETIEVSTSGVLLVKDIVTISNVKVS